MDYIMEYTLMCEIYDDMTSANEGFFGDIGSAIKKFFGWLIGKITDFINRLFKRKTKKNDKENDKENVTSTVTSHTVPSGKRQVGRDKNNQPYTRIDHDSGRMREMRSNDSSLQTSLKKQIHQMSLHAYRLTNDITASEKSLSDYLSKYGQKLSSDAQEDHLDDWAGLQIAIQSMESDSDELDAYVIGLNEMLDEYRSVNGDMSVISSYTNDHMNGMIGKLDELKKSSASILRIIQNCKVPFTDTLNKWTSRLTNATSRAISVTGKVISVFEKI